MGQPDGTFCDIGGVEHREVALVRCAAIDQREKPAVALLRLPAARNKDRLTRHVARGKLIEQPCPAFGIDMRNAIEDDLASVGRVRGKISVALRKACPSFVEAREFAGQIVQRRLLDRVRVSRKIEGPAYELGR